MYTRVTLIFKILEFQKAGSTTSRYMYTAYLVHYRLPSGYTNDQQIQHVGTLNSDISQRTDVSGLV